VFTALILYSCIIICFALSHFPAYLRAGFSWWEAWGPALLLWAAADLEIKDGGGTRGRAPVGVKPPEADDIL